jgi:ketosteroid isomerase-like protein
MVDLVHVEKELREFEVKHQTAIDSKDIEGVLQCYAPNLITIPPGGPIQYGKEWIRDEVKNLYETWDFHEYFKFIDIRVIGDRVAASYNFSQHMTPLAGGESVEYTGKGMCVLVRSEENSWQFEWNAYSMNKG